MHRLIFRSVLGAMFIPIVVYASRGPIGAAIPPDDQPSKTDVRKEEARISLLPLSFEQLQKKVLTNPKAKLILVDAWATWCATCKENFPHLIEMHQKYADKGLSVVSLSMDDPTDKKAVADALLFLKEKNAT